MKRVLVAIVFAAGAVAAPSAAHAEDPPWAKGVPADKQAKANELFSEGNELFTQLAHAPALEKYKAAVALWDHPMIRFNMAVTLIRLDRMLEAADALDQALRFGAKPFTSELYQQALDYQNLVTRQLGYVEAKTDQKGARVLLDGKLWFVGPGSAKVRVTAGEHVIVAERDHYMTLSKPFVIAGGSNAKHEIELMPIERAMKLTYRHPRWLPWTVTGAGAAITLGGLGFYVLGQRQMDDFTKEFIRRCPTGCPTDLDMHPDLADMERGAELKGKIAASMLAGGGVVAAAGLIWVIANRPVRSLPRVEVQPTTGGAAASVGWRF